ncbi:hypothetical protein AVEN_182470-1 [Araneus ventricosus]|uniref:Uncharacterized protein n=1 Tax=Araneus ventricosus TaxID=182803 RepID=A0A4Y2K3D3_ARAVE|nr:hypothetical protein AVEN_182470-1 [Araneus ventricosus]
MFNLREGNLEGLILCSRMTSTHSAGITGSTTNSPISMQNNNRGFFFAHIGWLMSKKHPDVAEKGKTVFMEDLLADTVVRFQRRKEDFYYFCTLVLSFL